MNHRELSNQIDLIPVIKCSRDKAFHLNWDFYALVLFLFFLFFFPQPVQNAFGSMFFFSFFSHFLASNVKYVARNVSLLNAFL